MICAAVEYARSESKGCYYNNKTEDVFSPNEFSTDGTQIVTATYKGVYTTFNVNVKKQTAFEKILRVFVNACNAFVGFFRNLILGAFI